MEFSTQLKSLLVPTTEVCLLTGAGVSKESGVATFRDPDGLWQKFRPEELANMQAFLDNPDRVWDWYEYRRRLICEVSPNAGHFALAKLQPLFARFTLVTQNVDGLHQRAGSTDVLELHGSILRNYCIQCGKFQDDAKCLDCGGRVRPDVVWFGESLPLDIFRRAEDAAETCDLFLSIGTSGAVFPAASLPLIARESGAYVAEINPQATEISALMNECLVGPSATILPQLLRLRASDIYL